MSHQLKVKYCYNMNNLASEQKKLGVAYDCTN